jgi:hypothetical protein
MTNEELYTIDFLCSCWRCFRAGREPIELPFDDWRLLRKRIKTGETTKHMAYLGLLASQAKSA